MSHALDNPVWHALNGPHAAFALGRGAARHYPRDIVPFSAIREATPEAYADLAADLPAGADARLHRLSEEPVPPGWEKLKSSTLLQMLGTGDAPQAKPDDRIEVLSARDIPDMLDLMQRTNPGRFGPRTPLLGVYLGIRDHGRLVAMAGERIRLPGFVELSSISTLPDYRRQGLAACLTIALMQRAHASVEHPFLHVNAANASAIALYRKLGFKPRRELTTISVRPL